MSDVTDAVTAPLTISRAEHDAGMAAYRDAGQRLAEKIGNRGPLRLTDDGTLHPDIQAAYWRHGYYVFTGVIDQAEIAALRADAQTMLARAPIGPDATVDTQGRPALGLDTPACLTASPSLWPTPGVARKRLAGGIQRRWPSRGRMRTRRSMSCS